METKILFPPHRLIDNSWEDVFILLIAMLWIVLAFSLWQRNSKSEKPTYDVKLAWMRAGLYFCFAFIISWLLGVFKSVTRQPLTSSTQLADPIWWLFTLACVTVIVIGYFIIWPKGTLIHGRKLHLPGVVSFGLLWGISEGLLFLSVWAAVERIGLPRWLVTMLAFFALAAFKGLWHSQYWDIYVAPKHNIEAWNSRKVLFAHIPNLVFTLSYLAIFGNAAIFVIFQTLALLASSYCMRFPAFWHEQVDLPKKDLA